ncbi:S-layer homology domain-containing protein [Dethiosulfatibacter aminovorans DSM 17477]|uniref:S-layer homology domain-containing protein n=1 Tax=Dethiosulfatibacter aminovorans DSM 17477 TaxID=1121476 RepID=A0A1M6KPT7_9FIRM|nr:S-layer homology domain-containing protein [Dethiosulfatibacter aminovorans]SHJ60957.1 S-layer homology domain-containing protein [Dethiosulfatibacter aminovorans DSM 17477]
MSIKTILRNFAYVHFVLIIVVLCGAVNATEAMADDTKPELIGLSIENDIIYLDEYMKAYITTNTFTDKIGISYDNVSDDIFETWTDDYGISGDTKIWEVEIKMEYDGKQKIVFWAGDGEGWDSAKETYIDVEEERPVSDIPQNVRADATEYSVTVRWDVVDSATSYYVILNGNRKKTDRNVYIFKDLEPDTEYTYAVRSNNSSGSSEYSPIGTIRTVDSLGPDVPQNVSARWVADRITIRWDEVEDADDYTVSFDGETYNTEDTSYVFEDITEDRDYEYAVCANNGLGSSRYSKTKTIDKDDISSPDFPEDIRISVRDGSITIRWSEVYGADDYTVILNDDEFDTDRCVHILKDLKEGKEYEYGVRANNLGGAGEFSPLEKFKIDDDGEFMETKYLELSDWALEHVKNIDENGMITDELLDELLEEPEDVLSRAEFCEMLVQLYESYAEENNTAVEYDPSKVKDFIDLDDLDVRTKDSILKANALGIVNGMSDTEFDPSTAITREMMAVMLRNTSRAMYGEGPETSIGDWVMDFEDINLISNWAVDSVRFTNALGILEGDGKDFLPKYKANHEMGLTLLDRSFTTFLDLYSQ